MVMGVTFNQFEEQFRPIGDRGFFELKTQGQLLLLNEEEELARTGQEETFGKPDSLFFIGNEKGNGVVFTWTPQQRKIFLI